MFEKVVADVLSNVLGDYCEGISQDSIKLGVFSGDVQLENVFLKASSLAQFNLPVTVQRGFCGKLRVQVPFKNLGSKPIVVFIDTLYVIATSPTGSSIPEASCCLRSNSPQPDTSADLKAKLDRLQSHEELKLARAQAALSDEAQPSSTFAARLVTKLADNVQVSIGRVHVRYEDETTNPNHPFAIGVTLGGLNISSCGEDWQPVFAEGPSAILRKLAILDSLAVYMEPHCQLLGSLPHKELVVAMNDRISLSASSSPHCILRPVSAKGRLAMSKSLQLDPSTPKFDLSLDFQHISVALEDVQYRELVNLGDAFTMYGRAAQWMRFRPSVPLHGHASQWWQFAAACIRHDIHDRAHRWSWEFIRQRRDDRKAYVSLYMSKLQGKKVDLAGLEERLSFDDIVFFRSIAEARTKEALLEKRKAEEAKRLLAESQKKPGFFSGWFWKQPDAPSDDKPQQKPLLEEDERRAFYATIGYQEGEVSGSAPLSDLPPDYTYARLAVSLARGSVSLVTSGTSLAEIALSDVNVRGVQCPASAQASLKLRSVELFDGTGGGTIYPRLVYPLCPSTEVFLEADFEHKPLDGHADSALAVKMLPLEMIYNVACIDQVVAFFSLPPTVSLERIEDAADRTIQRVRAQTLAQLSLALEERKTLDLRVDIHAPVIVIPEDCTRPGSTLLVADLGRIAFTSDLSQTSAGLLSQTPADEDRFYDQYDLKMRKLHLFLVPPLRTVAIDQPESPGWLASSLSSRGKLLLLEPFDLDLKVFNSIVPLEPFLTRVKVKGALPSLDFCVTLPMLNLLMPIAGKFVSTSSSVAEADMVNSGPVEIEQKLLEDDSDPVELSRQLFTVDFSIGRISATIMHGVGTSAEDHQAALPQLVVVVAKDLALKLVQRPYDLTADATLSVFEVQDQLQQYGPAFACLVASQVPESTHARDLLTIKYVSTSRHSPEYKNVDQEIHGAVGTLAIGVNRGTVAQLMDFATRTMDSVGAIFTQEQEQEEVPDAEQSKHATRKRPSDAIVVLKVDATLAEVFIAANCAGKRLATFSMRDLTAGVAMTRLTMSMDAELKHLEVSTGSLDSPHARVLSVVGDQVISFEFKTFQRTDDYPGYDTLTRAHVAPVKVTIVWRFIAELLAYITEFQEMQILLARGAIAAGGAALNAAKTINVAQRHKLDLSVDSPTVFMPQSSTKADGLLVELGRITAASHFTAPKDSPAVGDVVEHLDVSVSDAGLFTIESGSRRPLIAPSSLIVHLVRCLDVDYHQIPSIELHGSLKHIAVTLSENQYNLILSIADENFGDLPDSALMRSPNTELYIPPEVDALLQEEMELADDPTPTGDVWETLKVSFALEGIEASLEQDAVYGKPGSTILRASSSALTIDATGRSDDTFELVMVLPSVGFAEMIPESTNLFKEMVVPIATPHSKTDDMVRVSFTKDPLGARDINLDVRGMRLIIVPTVVGTCIRFLTPKHPRHRPPAPPPAQIDDSSDESDNEEDSSSVMSTKHSIRSSRKSRKSAKRRRHGPLTARFFMPMAELCVVENGSNASSRALALRTSLEVKYSETMHAPTPERPRSQTNVIALRVGGFGIFLSTMGSDQEQPLLEPLGVTVSSSTQVHKSQTTQRKIVVDVGLVQLSFSYRNFRLIAGIVEKLKELSVRPDADLLDADEGMTVEEQDAIVAVATTAVVDGPSALHPVAAVVVESVAAVEESFDIFTQGGSISLINDCGGQFTPLLTIALANLSVGAGAWSSGPDLTFFAELTDLDARFFNPYITQWEPVLEPWSCRATISRRPGIAKMELKLVAEHQLLLNVSHSMTRHAVATWSELQEDFLKPDDAQQLRPFVPFAFRNECGLPVRLQVGDNVTSIQTVDASSAVPFVFADSVKDDRTISLQIQGFDAIGAIPVDRVAIEHRRVRTSGWDSSGQKSQEKAVDHVVVDVALDHGSKIVTLRSPLRLRNDTETPLEILLADAKGTDSGSPVLVHPSAVYNVPLAYTSGAFRVRPADTGHEWNARWVPWSRPDGAKTRGLIKCTPASGSSTSPRRLWIQPHCPTPAEVALAKAAIARGASKGKVFEDSVFSFQPPLVLENLLPTSCLAQVTDRQTSAKWSGTLPRGGTRELFGMDLGSILQLQIQLPGCSWFSKPAVIQGGPGVAAECRLPLDDGRRVLMLEMNCLNYESELGALHVRLYAPYWMINHTGLTLRYRPMTPADHSGFVHVPPAPLSSEQEQERLFDEAFLFSYCKFPSIGGDTGPWANKCAVAVEKSEWAKAINLETAGFSGSITVSDKNKRRYDIAVNIGLGPGVYRRTKVVTFYPRFILHNRFSSRALRICQKGVRESASIVVQPGGRMPWHWADSSQPLHIVATFADGEWDWSGPFDPSAVGDLVLKLRPSATATGRYMARVEVKLADSGTLFIIFNEENELLPPYRIDNETHHLVGVRQAGMPEGWPLIPPGGSSPFCWDRPIGKHLVVFDVGNKRITKEFNPDTTGVMKNLSVVSSGGGTEPTDFTVTFTLDGPVRLMRLTDASTAKTPKRKKLRTMNRAGKTISSLVNRARKKDKKKDKKKKKAKAAQGEKEEKDLALVMELKGLGISVIDASPCEMLFLSVTGFKTEVGVTSSRQNIEMSVMSVQIDNHIPNSRFPILMSPKESSDTPMLYLSVVKSLDDPTINFFPYLTVLLQEISVSGEQAVVSRLLEFVSAAKVDPVAAPALPSTDTVPDTMSLPRVGAEGALRAGLALQAYGQAKGKLHDRLVFLSDAGDAILWCAPKERPSPGNQPTWEKRIRLTDVTAVFLWRDRTPQRPWTWPPSHVSHSLSIEGQGVALDLLAPSEDAADHIAAYIRVLAAATPAPIGPLIPRGNPNEKKLFFELFHLHPLKINVSFASDEHAVEVNNDFTMFLQAVGLSIINIENVPIRLNSLMLENPFVTQQQMIDSIRTHYVRQGIMEAYKIVGSFDFLGNPVGLFNNLSTGVTDFFYEPAQAITKGPEEFAAGLQKGTASLIKQSVFGTFNTASKITGTVGKSVASLSMDDEYVAQRQAAAASERPKDVGEGLAMGFRDLGKGIADGFTGLVNAPLDGAEEEGIEGFFKGLGKGIMGAASKPATGALDLMTRTAEGMRNTATMFDQQRMQVRHARFIGHDGVIRRYNVADALAAHLLRTASGGAWHNEKMLFHASIGEMAVLVTDARVAVFKGQPAGEYLLDWALHMSTMRGVRLEGTMLVIDHEPPATRSFWDKPVTRRTLELGKRGGEVVLEHILGSLAKHKRSD